MLDLARNPIWTLEKEAPAAPPPVAPSPPKLNCPIVTSPPNWSQAVSFITWAKSSSGLTPSATASSYRMVKNSWAVAAPPLDRAADG